MRLETLSHREGQWSASRFPDLDSPDTLVLAFGAPGFADHPRPLTELVDAYPQAAVVGCSTAGEIWQDRVIDDSLAVAIVRFGATHVRVAARAIDRAEASRTVGTELASELATPGLRAVFVLSDGLQVNGSQLVAGLTETLPTGITVTGGLAGDGPRFVRTWVLHGGLPQSERVVAVGLYGDRIQVRHGSRGGWDAFGPKRLVTRARDNVLYELDGAPALRLYKSYLGELARELPASGLRFPLTLHDEARGTRLVRTILAVDEDEQSLTFAGDVPEGAIVQLMKANFDRLVDGAAGAAEMARHDAGTDPLLAVAISCVGRRLVLGERSEDEVEAVLDELPAATRQVGFYSYGEISPHVEAGPCDLHNQTMTLTTIHETS